MHVACDHGVDQSGILCGPMCGLEYLFYVHLIMVVNLGHVISISCGYHVLTAIKMRVNILYLVFVVSQLMA